MAGHWATKASRLLGERGREYYRLAFALTGEHPTAERLLHESLGTAFRVTRRKTSSDEIDAYTRRAVYSTFLRGKKWTVGRKPEQATSEQKDRFLAALDTLDPQQRLCLVMRFYEGLSCAAIAKDLDVLPVTVRRYLDSAIEALGRPLDSLGLTKDALHYGGWTPGDQDQSGSQGVPTDTLSIGFTHIDDLASAGCPLPSHPEAPRHLVKAATRPRRGRSLLVAVLAVAAVGSLGVGGWAAVQAFYPTPVTAPEPSPTPSSAYGMGVLASDDVLDASESWYGQDGTQRILVCDADPPEPDGGDENSIPVVSEEVNWRGELIASPEFYTGECSQALTDAVSVNATIVPFDSGSGRTSVRTMVTITNTGPYSVAILRDSVGLYFELPWEALSFIPGSRETLLYLTGTNLDSHSIESVSTRSDEVTILDPGEDLTITFSSRVLPDDFVSYVSEEEAALLTPEIIDEIRRASSLVGELSEDDPVLSAFRSGTYIPASGIAITIAPSNAEPDQIVVLWILNDQVGELPGETEPSPLPNASPSPSAS